MVWLLLLSITFSRFTHVLSCIDSSSLFITEQYSVVWMYRNVFFHLPVSGEGIQSSSNNLGLNLHSAMSRLCDPEQTGDLL